MGLLLPVLLVLVVPQAQRPLQPLLADPTRAARRSPRSLPNPIEHLNEWSANSLNNCFCLLFSLIQSFELHSCFDVFLIFQIFYIQILYCGQEPCSCRSILILLFNLFPCTACTRKPVQPVQPGSFLY